MAANGWYLRVKIVPKFTTLTAGIAHRTLKDVIWASNPSTL